MHRENVPADTTAPYFFLSYAHAPHGDADESDAPDVWVVQLFNDLSRHVRQLAELPLTADPGFLSKSTEENSGWSPRETWALANCRVFVPLYSNRYFNSDHCGREWSYFTSRDQHRAMKISNSVDAIVPVVWQPVEQRKLPAVAQKVQVAYGYSGAYEILGLYGLLRLDRYKRDYEEAVQGLAREIVTVAKRSPTGTGQEPEYGMLRSAFGPVPRGAAGGGTLRITVVAPGRGDVPAGREDTSYYGRSPRDWNPYAPHSGQPIADSAAQLAAKLNYKPDVGDLCEHERHLRSAGPPTAPQILIVDPWALLLPHYQYPLGRLNEEHMPWAQVVVLMSDSDAGNRDHAGKLRATLDAVLRQKLTETAVTSSAARRGLRSLTEFNDELPKFVRSAERNYYRFAQAHPPEGPPPERPKLRGQPVPDAG